MNVHYPKKDKIMRRASVLWAVFAVAFSGLSGYSTDARADGLRFAVYSSSNNRCLDVYNFSTAPGAQVQSYACAGTTNQLWNAEVISYDADGNSFIRFVNANSGLCLDVDLGSTSSNVQTVQNMCGSSGTQLWKVSPPATTQTATLNILGLIYLLPQSQTSIFRTVINAASGLCLTTTSSNSVVQTACTTGNTAQLWRMPTF